MSLIRVLVDSFADEGLTNAQMTNAQAIVRRLDPARFHVSIFGLGAPDRAIETRENTRIIYLPAKRQTVPILRELCFGKHDVVFYVKPSPASKWFLRTRRRGAERRPTIGMIESQSNLRSEPTVTPEFVRLWEQTVLRCDYLFSNSQAVKESLATHYRSPSEVIPTGVDTKFFTPQRRPPNSRTRVFFVGSLRPFKQPHLLLQAATIFPEADFVIAGDGVMMAELKDRIRHECLTNVRMTGLLSKEALRQEYRQADIFLFPSLWEGSPKVILEAAACGLPVMARRSYRPETVVDGKTGFLVNSDDELFSRLAELLRSHDLRDTLGRAGRAHAETYDWDVITRRWEEVFVRVTSPRVAHEAA